MKYAQEIDWNNAIVNTGDHGEIIEVPFTVQSGLKTKVGEQNYLSYHRLLLKKSIDGFTYNHVQVLTKNEYFDNTDKSFNFYQITDDFDGIVLVINQNNEAVQFSSFKNSLLMKPSITGKMAATTCIYLGWQYEDGDFRAISLVGCFGGGGDSNDNGGYPPHVGGGGGSNTPPTTCQQGYIKDEYGNCVVNDQIINELTGKAKCLNDLLDKNGDSFVKNLLANFEGSSEFNINIVSKETVTHKNENNIMTEVNGKTTYILGSTSIKIEINTSRIDNTSALDAVRIILHEYIHADMFRKQNTQYPSTADLVFKETYETYSEQHGAMGALYINSMRDALKEFHKKVLIDDYNKYIGYYGVAPNDDFYEALAWGGLRENNVKAWTDLSPEKKTAIANLADTAIRLTKTVPCTD